MHEGVAGPPNAVAGPYYTRLQPSPVDSGGSWLQLAKLQSRYSAHRDERGVARGEAAGDVLLPAVVLGGVLLAQVHDQVEVVPHIVVFLDVLHEAAALNIQLETAVWEDSVGSQCACLACASRMPCADRACAVRLLCLCRVWKRSIWLNQPL